MGCGGIKDDQYIETVKNINTQGEKIENIVYGIFEKFSYQEDVKMKWLIDGEDSKGNKTIRVESGDYKVLIPTQEDGDYIKLNAYEIILVEPDGNKMSMEDMMRAMQIKSELNMYNN